VRDENRARLRADGRLDLRDVDVVDAGLAIDEDGDEAVLHQRRERGGKSDRRRDDLVAARRPSLICGLSSVAIMSRFAEEPELTR
jgi:hypothetical protein